MKLSCFRFVSLRWGGKFLEREIETYNSIAFRGKILIRNIAKRRYLYVTWMERNQFYQGFMMFSLRDNGNFTPETDNLCQTTLRDHLSRGYERAFMVSKLLFPRFRPAHKEENSIFSAATGRERKFSSSSSNCLLLLQFMIFSRHFPYRCIPLLTFFYVLK